jgi:hypothetical protein
MYSLVNDVLNKLDEEKSKQRFEVEVCLNEYKSSFKKIKLTITRK